MSYFLYLSQAVKKFRGRAAVRDPQFDTHCYNRTSVLRKNLTAPSAVKQVSTLPVFQYLTLSKTQKILTRMTPGVPEFNLCLILHAFSFDLSVSPPNIRTLLHFHTLPVLML